MPFDIPWYVYGLLAAFFVSLASIFEKKALQHDEPLHFSAASLAVIGLLSLPFLLLVDFAAMTPRTLLIMYVISVIATVAFFLVAYSLKRLDAGEQSLVLALTPATTALFAYVLLQEALTHTATIGLLFVVAGLITLEYPSLKRTGERSFHRKLIPLLLSFGAVLCYSGSAMFDRILLRDGSVSPFNFIVITQVMMFANFFVLSLFKRKDPKLYSSSLSREPLKIVLFSVLIFAARVMQSNAVAIAFVALPATLKRVGALFTVIFAKFYLKEKNIGHKLFAGAIILAGVVLIVL